MYLMKILFLFVLLSGLATAAAVPLRSFIRAVPSAVGRKLFAFFIKINEWQNSVIIRNETSYNFLNFLKGNLLSKAFCCSSTAALFIADSYRRVHDELRKEPQTYWTPFSRCEVQQLATASRYALLARFGQQQAANVTGAAKRRSKCDTHNSYEHTLN